MARILPRSGTRTPALLAGCALLCLHGAAAADGSSVPDPSVAAPPGLAGGFRLEESSGFSLGNGHGVSVSSSLAGEGAADTALSADRDQGLEVKRLSTSWHSGAGTLTVGNDWTNFRDVLTPSQHFQAPDGLHDGSVARQVRWLSPNGFSIAVEEAPDSAGTPAATATGDEPVDEASRSLVLSWQGGPGGRVGAYRVSALGKHTDGEGEGVHLDSEDLVGWGLNFEGGWQIGDLFAALSVTYGNGINRYVLKRSGDQLRVSAHPLEDAGDALGIRPSLYYRLNSKHSFHVALSHYASQEDGPELGIETLDTVHMGYQWTPLPGTQVGVHLIGQNADGPNGEREDSAQFKIGAQKSF